ncbi:MAG: hypothetical protein Q7S09_02510 [bacterium]|nr:hypothetical protein [bacterium]
MSDPDKQNQLMGEQYRLEEELLARISELTTANEILWQRLPGTTHPIFEAEFRGLRLTIEALGAGSGLIVETDGVLGKIVFSDQLLAPKLLKLAKEQVAERENSWPWRGCIEYTRNLQLALDRLRS